MASELSMNGKKKIETLQKEFTQKFPYLTLVFLDKERRAIDISKSLSEVRQAKGADISIIASLKVNTIEKRFLENYGLIVEVAYQKSDKVVYTKDNVDKTLNELNKWCQENDCKPFEFKKSLTGNTLSSVQEQLFEAIKKYYPNAEAKKINKDNYLDIYIPEINNKRGTHLFFNTAKDGIKIGFYCRDEEFVENVLSKSSNIEKYAQGIRILNNPLQNHVEEATASALGFIQEITGELKEIIKEEIDIEQLRIDDPSLTDAEIAHIDEFLREMGYGDDEEKVDEAEEEEEDEVEEVDKIDLDEMLREIREMEDGDDEAKEEEENDEEDDEISEELVDALFNSTKSKDNQSLMLDKNTIPRILEEINSDKNLKQIQITYYINNYSDLYFGLVYKVNNCNVEVNRVNWFNDSYWTGEIEREQLIEGLTEYLNSLINGLELFEGYIQADDCQFDRAGTLDNGVEFSITDLNGLTDIPKNLQDEDGELDVWELSNYLGPEEEDPYDENVGLTYSYEFSINGKTYGLVIDRSNEEKIDEEEMAEDENESSDKASLFFPINTNTTIVYDEVFEMNEGMIKVKKDDLFGFLDKEGNEIVPCNYVFASDFMDGVCFLVSNNEDDETVFDYINYKNEKYFSLKNYTNGNAPNKYGAWVQKEDTSKWEFYDIKGNLVHTADYDNVSKFKEGYSWCTKDKTIFLLSISGETKKIITFNYEVSKDLDNGLVAISVDEKYGFYRFNGTSITKFIYDDYKLNLSNMYTSVSIDEKWGIISSDGLIVIPCIYDDIEGGNDDLFIITLEDKKGVVDVTGNIIIEIKYDDIDGFEDDYAIIKLNGLYGVINLKGQEIVSCISSERPDISKSKLADVWNENGCILIDLKTGNPVLRGNYDSIWVDGNNFFVRVNDKCGWIDNKENVIIDFKFDSALPFIKSDLARVQDDEKFGFIDKTGNFKIKPIYADLEPFDGDYAIASLDGESYGLIDKNGKQIVEFKYSCIEYDTEGFFKLTPI